jgi:hypothetical protein
MENLGIGGTIGFKWIIKNQNWRRGFALSENRGGRLVYTVKNLRFHKVWKSFSPTEGIKRSLEILPLI